MRLVLTVAMCLTLSMTANASERKIHSATSKRSSGIGSQSPAPAEDHWNGFYAGFLVGGTSNRSALDTHVVDQSSYYALTNLAILNEAGQSTAQSTNLMGGIEAGYNKRAGSFVYGLEGDFDFSPIKNISAVNGAFFIGDSTTAPFSVTQNLAVNWLVTAHPRVGMLLNPQWLIYGTGGVALADLSASFSYTDYYPGHESASTHKTELGYVAGIGSEVALNAKWSLKAEYLHLNFANISTTSDNLTRGSQQFTGTPFSHSADLTSDVIRIGLNYKF